MYVKPGLASILWMFLLALIGAQTSTAASRREAGRLVSVGGIQSVRGVGACADFFHGPEAFSSLTVTADLIDILDGTASSPGIKGTYHHNLILNTWKEGKYALYAGPGLTAGHVRDLHNHLGWMAGLSGDAGLRVNCLHSISVSLEWQVDFALQFKNRYKQDLSLYRAGYAHFYYPYLRIQYCF